MKFKRIEDAFETCKKHLDSTNSRNTEIESFLVGYLIVLVIAEYEVLLEKILAKRADRIKDAHVQSFVKVAVDKLTRSIKIGEVSGLLSHFGSDYKKAFVDANQKTPTAMTYYDNIMANRHLVAHQTGTTMTLLELETAFIESKIVFQTLADALTLTADEQTEF
jgi:hypothetical protein